MTRDQVFISYSHADSVWMERLQTMLTPLQRQGALKVWVDTDIQSGQLWKDEIKQALQTAKVAVLLVSPDFLASRFIHEHELPPLLEAARKEGLAIIWIPLRPCLYEETEIGEYQAACDPEKPLSTLPEAQQEIVLTRIARTIKSTRLPALSESKPADPGTVALPNQPVPTPTVAPQPSPQHVPPLRPTPRPSTQPVSSTLPAIESIHGWSAQQVQTMQQRTAQALGLPVEFRDRLQDDSPGPLMVVIPSGLFVMGSPTNEPGRLYDECQHEVKVASFAIGKYAVTFEEYDCFADDTGRDRPGDAGWGRGRRPVINVTWHDATAYAEWLSQQTGQVYRLPTEAEWEYACRAGTTTAYHFGAAVNTDLACYCGGGVFESLIATFLTKEGTVEVGRYPANAWGLHDMHGNVWEWTCSEHDASYGGAEQRCVDKEAGVPRALRGGSWYGYPRSLRAATRSGSAPDDRNDDLGFRLARTFPF